MTPDIDVKSTLACVNQGAFTGALAVFLELLAYNPGIVEAMHLARFSSLQTEP